MEKKLTLEFLKLMKKFYRMKVPFFGTAREHKKLYPLIKDICKKSLLSGQSLQGKSIEILENKIKKIHNCKYSVALNSCTDALFFALKALNIKKNDEVIIPSYSFISTASSVLRTGANLIFSDVNSNGNLQIDNLQKLITKKTKALIYVHLFGFVENQKEIKSFCKKNKIYLIEDCAQAFGAIGKFGPVGSIGDVGCISFDPTKTLSAPGSGGMVITKSKSIYQRIKFMRYHGKINKYEFKYLGYNSQLPTLTADILLQKLKIDKISTKKRILIAKRYIKELSKEKILLPVYKDDFSHIYHKFVICYEKRDKLKIFLENNGIQTMIHYHKPLPKYQVFKNNIKKNYFKNAEILSKNCLSLPIHQYLNNKEVSYIIKKIKLFLKNENKN